MMIDTELLEKEIDKLVEENRKQAKISGYATQYQLGKGDAYAEVLTILSLRATITQTNNI